MRILILAGGGIGDILMTTPMFRAIKEKYPHSYLAVGVLGNINLQLLKLNKKVDFSFIMEEKKYKGLSGLIRMVLFLRRSKFDYCFYNHIGAGRRFFIIPFLSNIKNRIGFIKIINRSVKGYMLLTKLLTMSLPYVYGDKRRTEKNLDLLRVIGIQSNDYTYELGISLNNKKRPSDGMVGIHPGSDQNGIIKRWDIKRFNQLAQRIYSTYGYKIRFYIGPQENQLLKSIDSNPFIEIAQENGIRELIESLSQCTFFISNDSGLSHLAAALQIPTVVLYGPTIKDEYILPTKHEVVETENMDCRPCFYSRKECPIGIKCLNQIEVDDVFRALVRLH